MNKSGILAWWSTKDLTELFLTNTRFLRFYQHPETVLARKKQLKKTFIKRNEQRRTKKKNDNYRKKLSISLTFPPSFSYKTHARYVSRHLTLTEFLISSGVRHDRQVRQLRPDILCQICGLWGDVSNQGQSLNWFVEYFKLTYSHAKHLYSLSNLLNISLGVRLL